MRQGRLSTVFKFLFKIFFIGTLLVSNLSYALTFTVNSELDVPDVNTGDNICETQLGNASCTLRAALMQSNATVGLDTIMLPAGVYSSSNTSPEFVQFKIDDSVNIIGAGSDITIIDGMARHSVLNMEQNRRILSFEVTLSGITIRNGENKSIKTQLGKAIGGDGGGIYALDVVKLTLTDIVIQNNKSDSAGSGIYIQCKTCSNTIIDSVIENNAPIDPLAVLTFGGGLYFNSQDAASKLTIVNTSIRNNIASNGAGLYLGTGLTNLRNSSVNNNSAKRDSINLNSLSTGGGMTLENAAAVNIVNSTISGNLSERESGGIHVSAGTKLSLYNVTVTKNLAATQGGGLNAIALVDLTGVNLVNSIIAGNGALVSAPDCFTKNGINMSSGGFNIIGDASDCVFTAQGSDTIGTTTNTIDPGLADLAFNGGNTANHALNPGSPAIDAGNTNGCVDDTGVTLKTDQRGFQGQFANDRAWNGGIGSARCDIGAYERSSTDPVANAGQNVTVTANSQVTLNGTTSLVSNGTALYRWQQVSGTTISLSQNTIAKPTFTAPSVQGKLLFKLTITDSIGLQSTATVNVTIKETVIITENDNPVPNTNNDKPKNNNSSGGCSFSKNAKFDPLFILILLITLLQLLRSRLPLG